MLKPFQVAATGTQELALHDADNAIAAAAATGTHLRLVVCQHGQVVLDADVAPRQQGGSAGGPVLLGLSGMQDLRVSESGLCEHLWCM